jgi:hypothetical protein
MSGPSKRQRCEEGFPLDTEGPVRLNTEELVVLNVGGTRFATRKLNLTKQTGSFFASLVDSKFGDANKSSYFIDRSPAEFQAVLVISPTYHPRLIFHYMYI